MEWRCARGHQWSTAPRVVLAGSWCPVCAGHVPVTLAEMQALARSRGGACLARALPGSKVPVSWRCAEGHEWRTAARKVKEGSWCPWCAGRKDIDAMHAHARTRGGRCLSTRYLHGGVPLRWECAEGHRFSVAWRFVQAGRWCPHCAGTALHGTLERLQQLAAARGGRCLSARYLGSNEHHRWRCAAGHEWRALPATIRTGRWCPRCADRRLGIETMRELARARGGRCLSTTYTNHSTHLQWQCDRGHAWWASPSSIKYKHSWCPDCALAEARARLRSIRKDLR